MPEAPRICSIPFTVPDTDAWTGQPSLSGATSPMIWPTRTRSPSATVGVHGAPICWLMEMATLRGAPIFSVGKSFVSLYSFM